MRKIMKKRYFSSLSIHGNMPYGLRLLWYNRL